MAHINLSLSDSIEVLQHLIGHGFDEAALLTACLAVCNRLLPRYQHVFSHEEMGKLRALAELAATHTINLKPLPVEDYSKYAGATVGNGELFGTGD